MPLTHEESERLILVGPMQPAPFAPPEDLKSLPQVAVDGGIHAALNPVFWCGDGDSGFIPAGMPAIVKEDQNQTDIAFCLSAIRNWRWREMHLFGFLGGRRDHELANFGTLIAEASLRPRTQKISFYDDAGRAAAVVLPAGAHQLDLQGAFSIVALEPAVISLNGACAYEADHLMLFPLSGQGLSNEGRGIVSLKTDRPVIVFSA